MGISGLLPLLKSIQKPCNLKKFAGQTVGVDAYGWLHRGTVPCAIDLALEKPTTKYVDFAMSRVRMLIHFGVTPYLVFDGDYLPSKAGTEGKRAASRKESRRVGLELLKLGKSAQAQAELQKAVDVTPEMARLLIEELKRSKIQYVVAPYEADSQLAYLERKGIIQAILSEDSDLLVFGARCLVTKLDQYGDCVMIRRDDFTACREVSLIGWTDAEFRRMAILSGCDYLASISKMGLKTAYRLIRKHKTVDRIIRAIQFDGQFKVPPSYLDAFNQAEKTFLYQWVFCPLSNQLVHCTEPEDGFDASELPYIGVYVEPELARGVACGDLNPHTKEPIIVPSATNRSGRNMAPPDRRPSRPETPELKSHKSIDSFFKPKRTPLAELDPNCFTPSPSQQRLLERNPGSWSASPAPARTRTTPAATSAPFTAPQPPRRVLSDSWARTTSASHPSKRPRLCEDTPSSMPTDGSVRVESGRSRFFAPSSTEPSPSVRTSKPKKAGKLNFNLWSDDSIEDAMAELPDPAECLPRSKQKVAVFVDDIQSSMSTVSDGRLETSTVSIVSSRTTSQQSLTPATSFGSPIPEDASQKSIFSESLSAELRDLQSKFTYRPPESNDSALHAAKSTKPIANGHPRTALAPLSIKRKSVSSVRDPPQMKKRPTRYSDTAKSLAPSLVNSLAVHADISTKETVVDICQSSGSQDLPEPDIDDATFQAMDSSIVVLASETGEQFEEQILPRVERESIKGSEDFLVPDSEGEASEVEGVTLLRRPALDLTRFAFAP